MLINAGIEIARANKSVRIPRAPFTRPSKNYKRINLKKIRFYSSFKVDCFTQNSADFDDSHDSQYRGRKRDRALEDRAQNRQANYEHVE